MFTESLVEDATAREGNGLVAAGGCLHHDIERHCSDANLHKAQGQ